MAALVNIAVVLCPAAAAGPSAKDILGVSVVSQSDDKKDESQHARYLCALVTPSTGADTYEVNLWRQFVVEVTQMTSEVVLEYDAATRYYHAA